MIKWLCRQLDKLRGGNELVQWGNGRWYVQYNDNERSCTMFYGTALDYADIFGGVVKHVGDSA